MLARQQHARVGCQGFGRGLDEDAKAEAAERERLAALESESRQALSSVDAARSERSRALKAVNAQIKSRNDSIAKLKREAASLEKLVADLRRAMSDLPPTGGQAFEKVRGRLAWPVAGKLTARFGQARGGGLRPMPESPPLDAWLKSCSPSDEARVTASRRDYGEGGTKPPKPRDRAGMDPAQVA